jgi:acyl-coenzyme A synthetase/AMP-(fatty) acid ligase
MTSLPVLDPFLPDRVAFRGGEGAITHAELHGRAALLAESLPDRALVINYCERRDNFTLALMAALMRGQTALFPGDRNARTYAMLAGDNPDLYCLSDAPLPFGAPGDVVIDGDALLGAGRGAGTPRLVAGSHPAARVFTSGSTGKPTVNEKSWGMLVAGGKSIPAMLQLTVLANPTVVATVPSQHMYGFETAIMNVLQGAAAAHVERPVYPADIARCLAEAPAPRVLVTTPVHLRALVESRVTLPAVARVISATAPLSRELAEASERRLGAEVWEIYGFTEAGSVGGRRTVSMQDWTLRKDFVAREEAGRQFLEWPAFGLRIPFPDVVQIVDPGHIRLQGRAQDMVNIAGKRASLAGLTTQMLEINGVEDGVFWLPSEDRGMGVVARLVAFVVAPSRGEAELRAELQRRLDSAFVPRTIVFVDRLPRNATGKLTERAMKDLAAQHLAGDATA